MNFSLAYILNCWALVDKEMFSFLVRLCSLKVRQGVSMPRLIEITLIAGFEKICFGVVWW